MIKSTCLLSSFNNFISGFFLPLCQLSFVCLPSYFISIILNIQNPTQLAGIKFFNFILWKKKVKFELRKKSKDLRNEVIFCKKSKLEIYKDQWTGRLWCMHVHKHTWRIASFSHIIILNGSYSSKRELVIKSTMTKEYIGTWYTTNMQYSRSASYYSEGS